METFAPFSTVEEAKFALIVGCEPRHRLNTNCHMRCPLIWPFSNVPESYDTVAAFGHYSPAVRTELRHFDFGLMLQGRTKLQPGARVL